MTLSGVVVAASSSTGGPSVALSGWEAWAAVIFFLAAGLVAVGAFLRKIFFPLVDMVAEMRKDYPILVAIADKFGYNGSETISAELRALASNDAVAAANQTAMMAQLETVIMQIKTIDVKLSDTRHKIIGEFASLATSAAGANTLVEAIVKTSADLQQVRTELVGLQAKGTT